MIRGFLKPENNPLFKKIKEIYNKSTRSISSNSFDKKRKKADRLRDEGKYAEAAKAYIHALELDPSATELRVQLGNMAKDSGQYQLAISSYKQAIEEFSQIELNFNDEEKININNSLSDAYCQLGHLYKKMKKPAEALEAFRQSFRISYKSDVEHEIKMLIAGLDDYFLPELEGVDLNITSPSKKSSRNKHISSEEEVFSKNITLSDVKKTSFQCICGHKQARFSQREWADCTSCGTRTSLRQLYLQQNNKRFVPTILSVSIYEFQNIAEELGISLSGKKIALLNADIVKPELDTTNRYSFEIETLESYSDEISERGLQRLSFDCIFIPNLSIGVTDPKNIIEECFLLLKPNGILIVGFEGLSAGFVQWPKQEVENNKDVNSKTEIDPSKFLFLFHPETILNLLEIEERNGLFLGSFHEVKNQGWVAVKKSGELKLGVMSGIGDAAWSFLFAENIIDKYRADRTKLYIHDCGDHRRKRSNNLLERFNFIYEICSSNFDVHTNPQIDEKTGHIRYHKAGPTLLSGSEEFDYRLIFNTYFEHGWNVEQICKRFGLEKEKVNHNFFNHYVEKDIDLHGYARLKHFIGGDYMIFHYGALKDNTEVGLNRGEIWKGEDWNQLGRKLYETYKIPIVLIGAAYDLEYSRRILSLTDDCFYYNLIGQLEITETLSILKRAKTIISFPSGIGILGPYLGVPTVIFWRRKDNSYHPLHDRAGFEKEFAYNWAPPETIANHTYYPAFYNEDNPDTIMNYIKENNWIR